MDKTDLIMEDLYSGAPYFIHLCGAEYKGTQITAEGFPNVVWFRDPVSEAIIGLSANNVTIGTIWSAMETQRLLKRGL